MKYICKKGRISLSDLPKDLVSIGNTFTQVKRLLSQAILTTFDWRVWTHYVICCFCRSLQSNHSSQVSQPLTMQYRHEQRIKNTQSYTPPYGNLV